LEKLDLKYTDEQRMLKKQAAGYKMSEYREIVWTDERNEYLRENYSRFLNKALAKALNVSEVAITKQAYNLRLTKSEAYLADLKANVIPKIRYSFRSRKKEVNHG
jgi:hypothetical protein